MKIGIDVSQIIYETGVSIYTRELVRNLLALDKKNEYVLFGGSGRRIYDLRSKIQKFEGNFRRSIWPLPPTLANYLFNYLRFPSIEFFTGRLDVFHSSDWSQPKTSASKVTTVHDLSPLMFPKETHPTVLAVHKRRLELVKKEVDRVIVPSIATKKDLIDYGIAEEKIRVIFEAPSIVQKKSSDTEILSVKNKYGVGGDYLVAVGVGQRKNTKRLISAFEKAREGENLKLVLIGRSAEKYEDKRNLRFTGHVSDSEFAALVSGARVLVYPSLYEGFGLPILEAFSAGIPVVTSNVSSMPEIAGGAAVLVNPYDPDSIAEGIRKALVAPKVYSQKGLARVKDFSWEKVARETQKVYQEAD